MANWMSACVLICCVIFVFLSFEIDESEARGGRGGGGRGGGRFGGSRGRYSGGGTQIRNSYRYRYSGRMNYNRMYKGTYGYTSSTWKPAFYAGSIYGGLWYMRSRRYHSHPSRMPTLCRNTYDKDKNGTVYGTFFCPRELEDDDMDYCCGDQNREFCCAYFDSAARTAGIVIGVLIGVAILAVVIFIICKKSGYSKKVVRQFSSRNSHTHQYAAPAPVAFSAKTDHSSPPPAYAAGETKTDLPQGDVNQGGVPYPPAPGVYSTPGAGYPPTDASYPPTDASYPPTDTTYPPGAYPPTGPPAYPPQPNGTSYPASAPPPYPQ